MLTCQRDLVYLPEGVHYLNCAYMGPLLKSVEEAGIAAVRRRRDPTSITPADFFTDAERARTLFGQLVSCPAERVSLVPSVSYATAIVAKNLELRPVPQQRLRVAPSLRRGGRRAAHRRSARGGRGTRRGVERAAAGGDRRRHRAGGAGERALG
jgi:hypothetical protein